MKKIRTIIALTLAAALVLLFAACGEKVPEEASTADTEGSTGTEAEAAAPEEPGLPPETVTLGLSPVTDANEALEYKKIIVDGETDGVKNTEVTKTGMFCAVQDRFNDVTRYYVWGYGDEARSVDWQWEFVPADAGALPAQGSVITVKGVLKESEAALDRLRLENAEVSVGTDYTPDTVYDVDCRFMGSTLERVQVQNVSLFPEDFAGKTMAVYGRASGTAAVRQPYDGAEGQIVDWSLEFSSAYENPEADTMIVVTGSLTGDNAVMSGAVINILK